MRRIFSAFLLLWIMLLSIPFAEAAEQDTDSVPPAAVENREKPMRIALVPVVDRTGGWISAREKDEILERLEQEIHVPLNDTMHWVEYIPYTETEEAFSRAFAKGRKKTAFEDAVRLTSETLPADVVICAVVDEHYQREFISLNWDRDFMVESIAAVRLFVYDKKSDKLTKKSASRWERDDYSLSIEVQALTMDAIEEVLREADIRAYIFPISKEYPKIFR